MGEPARALKMTANDFLAFEGDGDTRYELVDGVVVAMAPPADHHGTIAGNAWGEITGRLETRPPCRAVVEAGVRLDDHNHYKADVAATCAPQERAPYVNEPFLVVEVLSPKTANEDLAVKVPRYKELLSVREIWVIDPRERWVQVWRRGEAGWPVPLPLKGSATFRSDALDDEVELDRLYRNSGL